MLFADDVYYRTRALPILAGSALLYLALRVGGVPVNAVALAIVLMVGLCLLKLPVAVALIAAALLGGLHAGMTLPEALTAFNDNLLVGAQVGITYVMIGAFAVALSRSGLLEWLAAVIARRIDGNTARVQRQVKWLLFAIFLVASLLSQNVVPVHIAFIPILIPPLLGVMNTLRMDRRAVACVLACAISASYLLLPIGFGAIYLNDILLGNMQSNGVAATAAMAPKAMLFPVLGILAGMLFAVFITYRKPRDYQQVAIKAAPVVQTRAIRWPQLLATLLAIAAALLCQIWFDSLLAGGLIGFVILAFAGIFRWQAQDDVFTDGVRLMAQIAVIITVASGFAGVLTATGDIEPLVRTAAQWIGDNKMLGAAIMLVVGLFITIGFGDSFASVPILAPVYVPLAITLGFSPLAAMSLLGAAAALGDAGSPASTITLGATAGLNADGQHDHIKDSVIPTFLHANLGMLLFAWLALWWL